MGRLNSAKSTQQKGQKMGIFKFNITYRIIVGLGAAFFIAPSAHAALTLCMSADQCLNFATAAKPCCCPDGKTKIVYNCPSGWAVSGTTCVRTGTSNASDSTGAYETSYGTCDATPETIQCHEASAQTNLCPCRQIH